MLTFVPHKITEDYKKVKFYRVNKELCDSEVYNELSPTAILLYSLLCDRLSLAYTNITDNKIYKTENYCDEDKRHEILIEKISEKILNNVSGHSIEYVKKQLNLFDDNLFDY